MFFLLLFLSFKQRKFVVRHALVDNSFYHDIHLFAFAIIGWADVIYAVVADKGIHLATLRLRTWIIHRY